MDLGSSRFRPQFGQRQDQRRATAFEGPSSSSLAVEVGDLAGVQCCASNAEVWVRMAPCSEVITEGRYVGLSVWVVSVHVA